MADITLILETSTATGSLALARGATVIAEASAPMRGADGERLMPTLVQLLGDAGVSTVDLRRVVCGEGPGGFTSLRIAAAIAKGLAESLGVPLWASSSLAVLALAALPDRATTAGGAEVGGDASSAGRARGAVAATVVSAPGGVIAVLDALRGDWYAGHFGLDAAGTLAPRSPAALMGRDRVAELASRTGATIIGAGAMAFDGGVPATPRARDVLRLAEGEFLHPVDLASWEPDYGRLAEAQVKWEQAHGRPLGQMG